MYRVRLFPFESSFAVRSTRHALIEGKNQLHQMWEHGGLEFEVEDLPDEGFIPEFDELHLAIDMRLLEDLAEEVEVGLGPVAQAALTALLKKIQEGRKVIALRYPSDDPDYRYTSDGE